jgi:hypothetical protein
MFWKKRKKEIDCGNNNEFCGMINVDRSWRKRDKIMEWIYEKEKIKKIRIREGSWY